jgi:hypothetical protein
MRTQADRVKIILHQLTKTFYNIWHHLHLSNTIDAYSFTIQLRIGYIKNLDVLHELHLLGGIFFYKRLHPCNFLLSSFPVKLKPQSTISSTLHGHLSHFTGRRCPKKWFSTKKTKKRIEPFVQNFTWNYELP